MGLRNIKNQAGIVVVRRVKFNNILNTKNRLLGQHSEFFLEIQQLASLNQRKQKIIGRVINLLKDYIKNLINKKRYFMQVISTEQTTLFNQQIDVTLPGRSYKQGAMHPLSRNIETLKSILNKSGFQHIDAPEIDSEWYNFTALNIKDNHPARALADTFYINHSTFLLRTHTSNSQIRFMQHHEPPIKVFSIGKVYRRDLDTTHSPMFHQLEVLLISKTANIIELKRYINNILCSFFSTTRLITRFRSSYFPFTEPSFEVDILYDGDQGNNDNHQRWLEILGCGLINHEVLKNVGINYKLYRGFALGFGIERLVMLKHNITDIRDFYDGDIRWLDQYKW